MFLFHVCLSPVTNYYWPKEGVQSRKITENFQALVRGIRGQFPISNGLISPKIGSSSPGDVVVVYLVFAEVPVALEPVETVEGLPVVVGERLVKATVDSVLNDEHSEMRSCSDQFLLQPCLT